MKLLNKIQQWTDALPEWQGDAARRLFQKEDGLAEVDYTELYALFKSEHGLPKPNDLTAKPLKAEHLPADISPGEVVILSSMRDLNHVNRILPGQVLNFAESGATIIYGGNGSGKSGYTRVMKNACRSRDQSEYVYPDANDPEASDCVPTALFNINIDGVSEEVMWSRDDIPPEKLSTIAVFDSRCARSYITDEHDVAYLPYGLDIVENLANKVLPELTRRLDEEIASIDIDKKPYEHLYGETAVGKAIEGLGEESHGDYIQKIGTLSDDEQRRISELNKALSEENPLAKATELRLSAQRLKRFGERFVLPSTLVNDE